MPTDDVARITVDGDPVGIIGLKEVLEAMAPEWAQRPDQEVKQELLIRLSRRNYIPDSVRVSYEKAFLREFQKHLGRPYEEDAPTGMDIKVLGPGCAQCDRLEREILAVMNELHLQARLDHVRDVKEIGSYGVMGTPALIINGQVKCVGRVPPRTQLKAWLTAAA